MLHDERTFSSESTAHDSMDLSQRNAEQLNIILSRLFGKWSVPGSYQSLESIGPCFADEELFVKCIKEIKCLIDEDFPLWDETLEGFQRQVDMGRIDTPRSDPGFSSAHPNGIERNGNLDTWHLQSLFLLLVKAKENNRYHRSIAGQDSALPHPTTNRSRLVRHITDSSHANTPVSSTPKDISEQEFWDSVESHTNEPNPAIGPHRINVTGMSSPNSPSKRRVNDNSSPTRPKKTTKIERNKLGRDCRAESHQPLHDQEPNNTSFTSVGSTVDIHSSVFSQPDDPNQTMSANTSFRSISSVSDSFLEYSEDIDDWALSRAVLPDGTDADAQYPDLSQPMEEMQLEEDPPPILVQLGQSEVQKNENQGRDEFGKELKISLTKTFRQSLVSHGPFALEVPQKLQKASLRVKYELSRIALACKVPLSHFSAPSATIENDYDQFWSWITQNFDLNGLDLPEPSSSKAWDAATGDFKNVSLAGEFQFDPKGPRYLTFRLKPLQIDLSHRFGRRFGNDRFLAVGIPFSNDSSFPKQFKSDLKGIREELVEWLMESGHQLLDRTWKVMASKDNRKSENPSAPSSLYLFAENGIDFSTPRPGLSASFQDWSSHLPMSVSSVIDWFIPLEINANESSRKVFSRIPLGLSRTRDTIVLNADAIISVPNMESKILDDQGNVVKVTIMNDGCGIMSRSLAIKLKEVLGIEFCPSAFQGRIGSAKGLWIVDCNYDANEEEDLWIKVTESQTKFEPNPETAREDSWRSFEVLEWSHPLSSGELNKQFLPILSEQGVPHSTLAEILETNLTEQVDGMKMAMQDQVSFFKWCDEVRPTSLARSHNKGVRWEGGLPWSRIERIKLLLASGFDPQSCSYLQELLWAECNRFCDKLTDKMKIPIGQSCYAFCVPDQHRVLKPNEVHLGFSSAFRTSKSKEMMLHDIDVLVARSPAHTPTDIRKVKCVFEPRLRALKDAIVFSTQGEVPLAHLLSGGDYDGDKVWVCWDQRIVKPFKNAPLTTPPVLHGLHFDKTKISDYPSANRVQSFLKDNILYAFYPRLLGSCTNYKESLCYWKGSVATDEALYISELLSNLVDAPKAGLVFEDKHWNETLSSLGLRSRYPEPLYKRRDSKNLRIPAVCENILDHLFFKVADPIAEATKRDFVLSEALISDAQLTKRWSQFDEYSDEDMELKEVAKKLKTDLDAVKAEWSKQCSKCDNLVHDGSFLPKFQRTFLQYTAILPEPSKHPLISYWSKNADQPFSEWKLLKASAMFCRYKTKLPWFVAMRELCHLKSIASGDPITMTGRMYSSLKSDSAYVKRCNQTRLVEIEAGFLESDSDDSQDESQYFDASAHPMYDMEDL